MLFQKADDLKINLFEHFPAVGAAAVKLNPNRIVIDKDNQCHETVVAVVTGVFLVFLIAVDINRRTVYVDPEEVGFPAVKTCQKYLSKNLLHCLNGWFSNHVFKPAQTGRSGSCRQSHRDHESRISTNRIVIDEVLLADKQTAETLQELIELGPPASTFTRGKRRGDQSLKYVVDAAYTNEVHQGQQADTTRYSRCFAHNLNWTIHSVRDTGKINNHRGIAHLMIAEDDRGCPGAFMGIKDGTLEMLFISPEERGKGLGKRLLQYGIKTYAVERVAVNEQNPQAKGFYEHMGFQVYKRTDLDEQGNPYPLLYMSLNI